MSITKIAFEIGYKELEAMYGLAFNGRRMEGYFEYLKDTINEQLWATFVKRHVQNHPQFPKLSDILDGLNRLKGSQNGTITKDNFIDDDCIVVECRAGTITEDDGFYETIWRCPKCDRFPNPTIPHFRGYITLRNSHEMASRLQERIDMLRRPHKYSIVSSDTHQQ